MTDRGWAERWMRRAILYAREGVERSSPNPRVGCVLVKGERLLSLAHSAPAGGPHAEVRALKAAGAEAAGASLFVTLEPCAHWGRTGPCADAIVQAGVQEVYIGLIDPDPRVSGQGVDRLRAAGVVVHEEILERECERLHAPFLKRVRVGLPWVSLKGAMSLDGQLATASGDSQWITGERARQHVHQLRAQVDAVLVGGETARADLPRLTVRGCPGANPRPVLLSRQLDLPEALPIAREGAIFFHGPAASATRRRALVERGVDCIELPLDEGGWCKLPPLLKALAERGINHLLVEGGGHVHGAFLREGLADDLYLYLAPKLIGQGRPLFNFPSPERLSDAYQLTAPELTALGDDLLLYSHFRW